jgi:sugar phosphate isomerase/epimerase
VHEDARRVIPKLGTTLYSLTPEFHARRYDVFGLIDAVGRRGLGPGLELVGFQSIKGFPEISPEFERRFREAVGRHGLQPSCLAVNVDVGRRRGRLMDDDEIVEYMEPQLAAAATLGFPVARLQFGATPAVIERLLPTAERLGVTMGMEIHSPHTVHHPVMTALRELYDRLESPHLGFIPDFGASVTRHPPMLFEAFAQAGVPQAATEAMVEAWNAPGEAFDRRAALLDRLRKLGISGDHVALVGKGFGLFGRQEPADWAEIGDRIVHVHGKFFELDADGNEPAVPYPELVRMLVEVGYGGFVSSEWEGWHWIEGRDGFAVIEGHHALLRRLLAEQAPPD